MNQTGRVPKLREYAGNRGKGRKRGVPNKTTKLLKEAILMAAEEAGGTGKAGGLVAFLKKQAMKENNAPFMALLAKVLPLQLAGENDGPINVIIQGPDAGLL